MPKKPPQVKLASDKEQIASVQEGGLEVCRRLGHLKSKHYNTAQGRVEIRCSRCGVLLSLEEAQNAK